MNNVTQVENYSPRQSSIESQGELQNLLFNNQAMDQLHLIATAMAGALITVPDHLRGNHGDCLAICMQAAQWRMNPYAVAQKTHIVNGKLGYESQLVHAVLKASGAIKGSLQYEYKGEANSMSCRVGAVLAGENQVTWGEWLGVWEVTVKNSPLWKTNPKQQIGYLQGKNWARLYAPDAILGVYTAEELEEYAPKAERDVSPVESARPAIDIYSDDQFNKRLPNWQAQISSGERTAQDVIATISSRFQMTADQINQIESIEVAQ